MQHPGYIWTLYSKSPFANPNTDLSILGLPAMSTQYASPPGPVDDTNPGLMSIAVDDNNPVTLDWDPGPGISNSPLVVWYVLSSESTAANRKVHLIWMPQDISIPFFAYDNYIGTGSTFGVDFGGGTPVDVTTLYANRTNSTLAHTYNWVAVLVQTATGWRVDVFRYDPMFGDVVKVVSTPEQLGTPCALDCDNFDQEIHVLFKNGPYMVTVYNFTP